MADDQVDFVRVRRQVVALVVAFAAYYVAGKLGQATTEIRSSNLGPVWPAYGVALAAVLRLGYRVWPALIAAAFLVAFQSEVPPIAAAGQAAAATLAALAGGALLKRVSFDATLSRLRDAVYFIVLGAGASALISATLGVAVLYATGVQAYSGISGAWLIYWMGDATGALLITPLALSGARMLADRRPGRLAEFTFLLVLLALVCLGIFGDLAFYEVRLHVLAFVVMPLVIWAAARFGVAGVMLSTLEIATIATVATALGSGPFAQNSVFTNAVLLDIFFAVLAVSGLILAAVIAERERVEAAHERLIRAQAATEERLRVATELREAELKANELRDELAHFNRVGMLSALTGALAHEINQPLTAVGVNVETARLLLASDPPSLDELSSALDDIRKDNRRAGDVLQQVRTLLRKSATHYQAVDLNAVVGDVVKLVQASAIRRGVLVDVELTPESQPIRGDRVQVQQVVLNILMNACDAVEGNERPQRRVSLRTVLREGAMAIEVRDRGHGFDAEQLARLFEPFYTTKRDGMGLGLSICRYIVSAHGGTLSAERNPDVGMTFLATFPLWEGPPALVVPPVEIRGDAQRLH